MGKKDRVDRSCRKRKVSPGNDRYFLFRKKKKEIFYSPSRAMRCQYLMGRKWACLRMDVVVPQLYERTNERRRPLLIISLFCLEILPRKEERKKARRSKNRSFRAVLFFAVLACFCLLRQRQKEGQKLLSYFENPRKTSSTKNLAL